MAKQVDESVVKRLRSTAEEVLSLNLGDLDAAQLEKRISLLKNLREAESLMGMHPDCGTFSCDNFVGKPFERV